MNEPLNPKITRFVVFCVEAYKREKTLSGSNVISQFDHYGVIEYLIDGFDVLHSLGEAALVDDINDFIQRRRG